MPEPNFISLYAYSPEPPKKSPVIKLSCGIGDTDGFPAFDVDSEAYDTKDDSRWGFLMTGGAEFHMPLTVFQVTPDSLADKGGIRLGDVILEINEEDSTKFTLAEAHEKINATPKKIHFLVKSMEEDPMEQFEVGEEKSIVLRIPKPMPPPKVEAIEKRLRDMQRKLSEIAEIPKILSSTLATVSQTFDKLAINGVPAYRCSIPQYQEQQKQQQQQQQYQKRKMSYDEDAVDYELSDEDNSDDVDVDATDALTDDQFDAKEAYRRLRQHVARQRKSKDVTPESDYASESNYAFNENDEILNQSDDNDNNEDDDDNDKDVTDDNEVENESSDENWDNTYQEFNLKLFLESTGHSDIHSSKETNKAATADVVVEEEEDEEDFLTTTFTMNLRNKPKTQTNVNNNLIEVTEEQITEAHMESDNGTSINASDVTQQSPASPTSDSPDNSQQHPEEWLHKQTKLDKFWPWADREKIIYKQSTCHLVPKKPLGLIGQRIQLLAKRNLLQHLQPAAKSN